MRHIELEWLRVALAGTFVLACSDRVVAPDPASLPAPRLEVITGDSQFGAVGSTLASLLTVRATRGGNPLPDARIVWTAMDGRGTISTSSTASITDAAGYASVQRTLGPLAGWHDTVAEIEGTPSVAVRFVAIAHVHGAVRLSRAASDHGDEQADTVLAPLRPYRVFVGDHLNRPVAGVAVRWSTGVVSSSDAHGHATLIDTLGKVAGTRHVTAEVQGLEGSPVTFSSTALPGKAAWLTKLGDDPVGLKGQQVEMYRVAVSDAHGNGVLGVAVQWEVLSGGGRVVPDASHSSPGDSVAVAYATHVLGPAEGIQTVRASSIEIAGSQPVLFHATAVSGRVSVESADYWACFYYRMCAGAFRPADITISRGETVAWVWSGTHCNLVFEDAPTEPASMTRFVEQGVHMRTFTEPGTYRYRCTLYSSGFDDGMTGSVTVR